jgi:hypothetical protein
VTPTCASHKTPQRSLKDPAAALPNYVYNTSSSKYHVAVLTQSVYVIPRRLPCKVHGSAWYTLENINGCVRCIWSGTPQTSFIVVMYGLPYIDGILAAFCQVILVHLCSSNNSAGVTDGSLPDLKPGLETCSPSVNRTVPPLPTMCHNVKSHQSSKHANTKNIVTSNSMIP